MPRVAAVHGLAAPRRHEAVTTRVLPRQVAVAREVPLVLCSHARNARAPLASQGLPGDTARVTRRARPSSSGAAGVALAAAVVRASDTLQLWPPLCPGARHPASPRKSAAGARRRLSQNATFCASPPPAQRSRVRRPCPCASSGANARKSTIAAVFTRVTRSGCGDLVMARGAATPARVTWRGAGVEYAAAAAPQGRVARAVALPRSMAHSQPAPASHPTVLTAVSRCSDHRATRGCGAHWAPPTSQASP